MNLKYFGKRLKAIRRFRGLTGQSLSEKIGVSSGEYISRYETGRRAPSLDNFIDICNELKISPDFLLRDYLTFYENINDEKLEAKIKNISPQYLPLLEKTVDELILKDTYVNDNVETGASKK